MAFSYMRSKKTYTKRAKHTPKKYNKITECRFLIKIYRNFFFYNLIYI